MKKEKIMALVLAAATVAAMSSCGKKGGGEAVSDMKKGEIAYPIETSETVRWWMTLPSPLATAVSNFAETDFAGYLKEATGIDVEFIHPAQGSTDAISLLLASENLPDIISTGWAQRSPESCIEQGLILDITEYVNDYAPNYKRFVSENDDVRKAVMTDSGAYYAFPFVRNDPTLLSTRGLFMRADWLEELGLEAPETIEDWDKTLAAFKTKCETPLAIAYGDLVAFTSGFNARKDMYHDSNGKVKFGPIEENYKGYIAKL